MMLSNNMFPRPPQNDLRDRCWGDLKFRRERRATLSSRLFCFFVKATNGLNAGHRQFCLSNALAAGMIAAVLLFFVTHVIGVSPEEKTAWVAAPTVVADVADIKAIGNRSVLKFPRNTVRKLQPSLAGETAMTALHPVSLPRPAGVRTTSLVYVRPETLVESTQCQPPKPLPALPVHVTECAGVARSSAGRHRADRRIVARRDCKYRGVSHGEFVPRCGLRRRTVSSGRRLAFMARLPRINQRGPAV